MKKIICFFICACFMMQSVCVFAEGEQKTELGLNAKSVVLMEESTGNILYESNPDERVPIASVTKVMTMLLIMEAVDSGKITLDDMVTVSENAMSYGGSTMFLEAGEQLTVNDMMKGIAVASANDGCVAMAEHLAGSESAFVDMMNAKAQELGMENTHFMNTNGLDEDDHYSSARDVAIMSRELIKHKTVFNYTSIWMDTLRGGKFQLANTNKLIRFYEGANGLKTGSTSKALCCLSATAKRNDMQLIAVVLGAPTSAERFSSARSLLDYGFANYETTVVAEKGEVIKKVKVEIGTPQEVQAVAAEKITVLTEKGSSGDIKSKVKLNDNVPLPLKKGDEVGKLFIYRGDEKIAEYSLAADRDVKKASFGELMSRMFKRI